MQKTMKRTLALILAVMLCLSCLPYSAFATEAPPDEPLSSQAPPSEAPAESSQPEPSAGPDVAPQPDLEATPSPEESPEPSQGEEPSPTPEADSTPGPSAESSASPKPAAPGSAATSIFETELSTVEARQVWPALQRAKARAAAGVGTAGVLQMGYYCFPMDNPNLVATLGNKYIGRMPAKSMLYNGKCIAAYCLDQDLGATADQPYTWADVSKTGQDNRY